jgi:UDP-3-O-[3-hydroxymyristoyl] N-acetylglucosamine deacetylase
MFAPFVKTGMGVHSGRESTILVEAGLLESGVCFLVGDKVIPARPGFIDGAQARATALKRDNARVCTVEHLLAALTAFGETDVRIAVEGEEVPILDGSALPFAEALMEMGAELGPRFVELAEEVVVEQGDSRACLTPVGPSGEPFIKVDVDFGRSELAAAEVIYYPRRDDFFKQLAPARTFAFESDLNEIFGAGLARGGSLDCALVLGEHGPVNPEGMRFEDEPARHKLLDAIGDLSLLGGLPRAEVRLVRPGHRLLHALVRKATPFCSRTENGKTGKQH